jgi:hypothetical protein
MVGFIELRDRFDPRMDKVRSSSPVAATTSEVTPNEARLVAMIENAKNSSWRDNLRNACDAQGRFMLPLRDVDDDKPEFMRRINARSREIMRDERERREMERRDEADP